MNVSNDIDGYIEETLLLLDNVIDGYEIYSGAGYSDENADNILKLLKICQKVISNFKSGIYNKEIRDMAIEEFVGWCYINGIDFSYMSTNEKSAKQFCDEVIERYKSEKTKEEEIANKRIYISGAITGTTDYMERFAQAEADLKKAGYEVVNPAKVNAQLPQSTTYDDYMKMSLCMLEICDYIYMLRGWQKSKGANTELKKATELNLCIIFEKGGE